MTDVLTTIRARRDEEAALIRSEINRIDGEIDKLRAKLDDHRTAMAGIEIEIQQHGTRKVIAMEMLGEIGPVVDPYHDNFGSWEDVVREYAIEDPEEKKQPDEVLYAGYSYECYEGSSEVIIRRGSKYYWNTGSHCSCYGLEGQWTPVEYDDPKVLAASLGRHYRNQDTWGSIIERLNAQM